MSVYTPPLDDIRFTLTHVAGLERVAALPGYEHADAELSDAILDEAGRLARDVLAPLNPVGDAHGAVLENGVVRTAPGFKEAYRQFAEGGWMGLVFGEAHGGQGLPWLLNTAVGEMWNSANMTLMLCPLLTQAACEALEHDGSEAQKEIYLRKLIEGRWTGAMCLTEPQAGTDVGGLRTKAVREGDHYRINGQKIFITFGDHDMAENVVHLVLARLPDAPAGTKGISLFIVPKFLPDENGDPGRRNDMRPLKLEQKLGIHGSPTCVMAYGEDEGAIGYLLGDENRGMAAMFTMMNNARLAVGLEGLGLAGRAYQQAAAYAQERQQFGAAIMQFPDVIRMLATMRARIAAMRCLCFVASANVDQSYRLEGEMAAQAAGRVAFLTPIVKAWCTDMAQAIAFDAVQVHGGMGFIEETGVAQHYRDARILTIYEGTNGVQAMDLVGRKLSIENGQLPWRMIEEFKAEIGGLADKDMSAKLSHALQGLADATEFLQSCPSAVRQVAGVDYLNLCGHVIGAIYLARGANAASSQYGKDWPDLARFFAATQLPKALGLVPAILAAEAALQPGLAAA